MPPASNLEEPLNAPSTAGEDWKTRTGKQAGKACGGLCLVAFLLAWALQGLIYWATTSLSGCGPSSLLGYDYPGGGTSSMGGAAYNLVPRLSLLVQRPESHFGDAFDVIPSNEASTINAAPAGAWYRTWGPIYYTYTYQDVSNSKTTAYMRKNLLRLGQSHRIMRCDGQGPSIMFEEGLNYFGNRLRQLFKMNQAYSYKIFWDGELVMVAEETGMASGFPSMTFRNTTTGKERASAVLKDRNFHGKYDEWLTTNDEDATLPFYVTSAATMLFADALGHIKDSSQPVGFMALAKTPLLESANSTVLQHV